MTTPSNTPPKGSKNLKHCQMMANTTEHLKFIPTKVEKQKTLGKDLQKRNYIYISLISSTKTLITEHVSQKNNDFSETTSKGIQKALNQYQMLPKTSKLIKHPSRHCNQKELQNTSNNTWQRPPNKWIFRSCPPPSSVPLLRPFPGTDLSRLPDLGSTARSDRSPRLGVAALRLQKEREIADGAQGVRMTGSQLRFTAR